MEHSNPSITGRQRQRKTGLRVRIADVVSRWLITTAGIGTIIAVTTVFLFLAWVVLPLFMGGEVEQQQEVAAILAEGGTEPDRVSVDEYGIIGWAYYPDGTIQVFRADDGRVLWTRTLFEDQPPTCHSFTLRGGDALFGFADGTVRLANIDFKTSYLELDDVDPELRLLEVNEPVAFREGMMQLTPTGQFRLQQLVIEIDQPIALETDQPVRLVDLSMQITGPVFTSITEDGTLRINGIRRIRNIMTGQETIRLTGGQIMVDRVAARGLPRYLLLEGRADTSFLIWPGGELLRYDLRDRDNPVLAETLDLIVEPDIQLTALDMLIGKMTILVGDSSGRITTWFRVKPEYDPTIEPPTVDASELVQAQVLPGGAAGVPVTSFAASKRTRMLATGYEDGRVRLFHVTSQQLLEEMQAVSASSPITALAMAPKDDGIVAASGGSIGFWRVRHPHPQSTFASIFTPVWYEGFVGPAHVWQSSSGSDEFEPKYGLYPLIFGTIKATVYTMIFAVPLALLAAIFTSEFLHPRTKAKIKPTIEIMASLPSVVLGFLAALIVAPFLEQFITALLLLFVTIPLMVLLAAFLWQLLPYYLALRFSRFRFMIMLVLVPVAVFLAMAMGRGVENWLFAGSIRGWLSWSYNPADPQAGAQFRDSTGGWMILMLPVSALIMTFVMTMFVNPFLRDRTASLDRFRTSSAHLLKFIIGIVLTLVTAFVFSKLLSVTGYDPRGSYVDTYVQRNALIVGFMMGFAVIPIIYTISEDALNAVPDHLRAGSLGAGATPWQTAIRIIIPTAMSGLFSAVMIGLGRAVGETMIVLMAAGNTPVLDWNMFSGFRTLSANIAVELPEAVRNGTNYRLLFMAALTLFIMTFALNTVAEAVRLRFRKRAFQL